jgi:hypothetical protein
MRHFIYTAEYKRRRVVGGCNYTIEVYENKGKNQLLKHIGTGSACTSYHKGEESEAWDLILENIPSIKRKIPKGSGLLSGYYNWSDAEEAGIKLQCLFSD